MPNLDASYHCKLWHLLSIATLTFVVRLTCKNYKFVSAYPSVFTDTISFQVRFSDSLIICHLGYIWLPYNIASSVGGFLIRPQILIKILLCFRLVVSQNQRALHIVFPHHFLDSPEWFGVSTDEYFQVNCLFIFFFHKDGVARTSIWDVRLAWVAWSPLSHGLNCISKTIKSDLLIYPRF